jgi:nucleoside-diphosphate-sugar epimerase
MPDVVVVTGASAGIGRAIARRFSRDGASVGLLARGHERLERTRDEVEGAGGRALVLPVDVTDAAAVDRAADQVERALGPIDVWVNDAMTTIFSPFEEITPDEFRRATEVTYLGAVWGTRAALARMQARGRGTIVQVGSAMAYRGIPLQAPYCGAKHALNTPQFDHCRTRLPRRPRPVPPVYQPELAAEAVHWAAHRRRREVYVGLPTVYTILGNKLAPWLAERYLARTAVDSQLGEEPVAPERDDNLFDPPAGDPGARGAFDDEAHARSAQFWLTRNRRSVALAGAGLGAALAALLARR